MNRRQRARKLGHVGAGVLRFEVGDTSERSGLTALKIRLVREQTKDKYAKFLAAHGPIEQNRTD